MSGVIQQHVKNRDKLSCQLMAHHHIATCLHLTVCRLYNKSFTRSKTLSRRERCQNWWHNTAHSPQYTHITLLTRCIRNTVSLKLPPKMVRVIGWWSLLNTFHLHLIFSLSDQLCYQSKQMKWPSDKQAQICTIWQQIPKWKLQIST